jgi:glycylpeptide N-tetradecanoyltransferase
MNCLEIQDNPSFLQELRFGRGDGDLHYYLYNYKAKHFDGKKVGLVML